MWFQIILCLNKPLADSASLFFAEEKKEMLISYYLLL